ncbi:MAG: hypothetical protein Q8L64_04365 [bacterium]|nr:hypothetical protein [bacterium]
MTAQSNKSRTTPRRVRTVTVPLIPTLEEFLADVVRMQRKYAKGHRRTRRPVFTAMIRGGFKSPPASTPQAALEELFQSIRESFPDQLAVSGVVIRVGIKGCSFDHSIPCAIAQSIADEAAKPFGLQVRYDC